MALVDLKPMTAIPAPQVVTDFCEAHLSRNTAAFKDPRLQLINDDARAQLEVRCSCWSESFH